MGDKNETHIGDITQKDHENERDMFYEDNDATLLGRLIKPEVHELKPKSQEKFKLESLFRLKTFKTLHTSAIVSVTSIYQKLQIKDASLFKKVWDIIMELILAYNVITTLFFLAYEDPAGAMLVIDYVHWIFFIVDIGLTVFTEKINEKGFPIRKFKEIFWLYLKGWLLLDILAVIPLRAGGGGEHAEYYLRMVRLLKLPGVLDLTDGTGVSYLLTYFSFGKRQKDGKVLYTYTAKIIASLIKLFISVIFIVYFLGCFFFWYQGVVSYHKYSGGDSTHNEGIFAVNYNLDARPAKEVALISSYYMLTTISTIGYGDYLPQNIYEMSFVMCVMLFGVTLFAYIMGSFNNAITYYNDATSGVDYLGELNTWLDSLERLRGKIPEELRAKVVKHFEFYYSNDRLKSLAKSHWEADTVEDLVAIDQKYADQLPEEIYYNIIDHLFSHFISSFKYYLGNTKLRYAIIPHLQPRRYEIGQMIFTHGKDIKEVAFILSGGISVGIDINEVHQTFLFLEGGRTVVGDYPALTKTVNKLDYLVKQTVTAYVIDAEVFMKILDAFFRSEKTSMLSIAANREKNLKRILNDHVLHSNHQSLATEIAKNYDVTAVRDAPAAAYSEEELQKHLADLESKTLDIERTSKKAASCADSISDIRGTIYSSL